MSIRQYEITNDIFKAIIYLLFFSSIKCELRGIKRKTISFPPSELLTFRYNIKGYLRSFAADRRE